MQYQDGSRFRRRIARAMRVTARARVRRVRPFYALFHHRRKRQ